MAEKEDDKKKLTVRKGVTHKKQKVLDQRCWHDDYTNLPYDKLVDKAPQVDHVMEVQVLDKAWNGAPPAARTREGHKQFAKVCNDLGNLNVTTREANIAKRDATTRFLRRADSGLRSKPLEECFSPAARDRGDAARMEKAVVRTWDDYMEKEIGKKVKNKALSDALVDEVGGMMGKTGV